MWVAARRFMRCRVDKPHVRTAEGVRESATTRGRAKQATVCERPPLMEVDTLDAKPTAREADRSRKRLLGVIV